MYTCNLVKYFMIKPNINENREKEGHIHVHTQIYMYTEIRC